jgi:RHH-type proline utilization regulon transcriptional repressor/proline dehydrogenase/delta 1-pyrroline-5-carboxylate dehydrogenase
MLSILPIDWSAASSAAAMPSFPSHVRVPAIHPGLAAPPQVPRLPFPYRPEAEVVRQALAALQGRLDWPRVIEMARPWVQAVRDKPAPFWAMESLLREYPISSAEGLALMRLAEALLRVPDAETAVALTADQLGRAEFDGAGSDGPHKMLATLSASAIGLSKKFLPEAEGQHGLLARLGAKTVVAATVRAIQLLGRQFVLGRSISEAMQEAAGQRRASAGPLRFSYDMLGEGARTEADAERYLASYAQAIDAIAGGRVAPTPEEADGISIKLSALFTRYEDAQRERVFAVLLPRVWSLIERAAKANLNLTIDAEESDRLELSLELLDALAARIAERFPQWRGFGLAVQAYQTRVLAVVDEVARIARARGLRFMVRLVKGAYWDGEIKRAQELGLPGYPVFTHKQNTDISYLAAAQALLGHKDVIYPQFATHNAGTIAAILQMAQQAQAPFEMQRLHGMGEGVYREVSRYIPSPSESFGTTPPAPPAQAGGLQDAAAGGGNASGAAAGQGDGLVRGRVPVRVYAPVGEHRDLLAYLVRRLLENGANSSFVHQLADEQVDVATLLASPLAQARFEPSQPLPVDLYGANRRNSMGADLACLAQREPLTAAVAAATVPTIAEAQPAGIDAAMAQLQAGFARWSTTPVSQRAAILRRAADALEARLPEFCGLLVKEAYKTLGDCIAEVREAVDFLRYYAEQAEAQLAAPDLKPRGVFVCISPWNFPLAIFAGQVVAALVAGNTVAAKPAEQTPAVAARMVALLHEAGVPADALQLLHGAGETVGAALVADARTAGVCFTGSTQVAQIIHRALAASPGADGAPRPLIAETGGLNAMIVDSTALPEQVIDAVVMSAFRSAGQRCSALRLLAVHESIADGVIEMLKGAMAELVVGDPAEYRTDVGPVIDDEAFANIEAQVQRLQREARRLGDTRVDAGLPRLVAPVAFELRRIDELKQEIFGPVLHVVRWGGDVDAVVDQINALGYGLTFGIQTRIDTRAQRLAERARIGNVYVNRNMIGAVVGVQPFGGEGMSGTGPKAGGPHYLRRFVASAAVPVGEAAALALPPTLPGLAADLAAAFDTAATAQAAWATHPLAERVSTLQRAAAHLPADVAAAVRAVLAEAGAALAVQPLPGPTGESNELRLHPRGVFALLTDGASPALLARALAATLVCGNAVLLVGDADAQPLLQALERAGVPGALLAQRPGAALDAVAQAPALAGIVAAAERPLQPLAQRMAGRPGAIVPLVTAAEVADARQLYRFCAEQTLTINTAAAGGNAALLAGIPAGGM